MGTKTTTATKAARNMGPAEINTTAAAVLLKYKSISAIKAAAAKLRAKYGAENWGAILATAKSVRRSAIDTAADNAKAETFNYRAILGAIFARLARSKDWAALCKYAGAKYPGKDYDTTAAALVRDYYPNTDTAGAPVAVCRYVSESRTTIFETWAPRELSATAAVTVLQSCLKGMAAAAKRAATKGADTAKAAGAKVHSTGVIAAVYEAGAKTDKAGAVLIVPGRRLDTDTKAKAATLIGRAVPSTAAKLTTVNADIRAARAAALAALEAAAGPKATAAEKHAAKDSAPVAKARAPKGPKAEAVTSAKAAAVAAA